MEIQLKKETNQASRYYNDRHVIQDSHSRGISIRCNIYIEGKDPDKDLKPLQIGPRKPISVT